VNYSGDSTPHPPPSPTCVKARDLKLAKRQLPAMLAVSRMFLFLVSSMASMLSNTSTGATGALPNAVLPNSSW